MAASTITTPISTPTPTSTPTQPTSPTPTPSKHHHHKKLAHSNGHTSSHALVAHARHVAQKSVTVPDQVTHRDLPGLTSG
jgi:hypothetical protein